MNWIQGIQRAIDYVEANEWLEKVIANAPNLLLILQTRSKIFLPVPKEKTYIFTRQLLSHTD